MKSFVVLTTIVLALLTTARAQAEDISVDLIQCKEISNLDGSNSARKPQDILNEACYGRGKVLRHLIIFNVLPVDDNPLALLLEARAMSSFAGLIASPEAYRFHTVIFKSQGGLLHFKKAMEAGQIRTVYLDPRFNGSSIGKKIDLGWPSEILPSTSLFIQPK